MGENFDREIEIANHAPDDGQLLVVFFAKNGGTRLDQVEELEDDEANAVEMAGAGGSAEGFRKRGFADAEGVAEKVEAGRGWGEDEIHAFLATLFKVGLDRAGVGGEVTEAVELGWIDKDRNRDAASGADELAGVANECEVAVVE